jgi:hypothetical protein
MAALSSGPCSRFLGLDGFLPFNLTAETEVYGCQRLFAEGVFLSRAEPGEQRRGDPIGRDGILDRGFNRPAALV